MSQPAAIPATIKITNKRNIPFNVRLVRQGERYGKDNGLIYADTEPAVEFFDARYDFAVDTDGKVLGQFVSRYFVSTIYSSKYGVALDGGVPAWVIEEDALAAVQEWLRPLNPTQWESRWMPKFDAG